MERIILEREKKYKTRKSVLVIYDISCSKNRTKVSKELEKYGKRVQESAFELHIRDKDYEELIELLDDYREENDSIRFYPLLSGTMVINNGNKEELFQMADVLVA